MRVGVKGQKKSKFKKMLILLIYIYFKKPYLLAGWFITKKLTSNI